MDLLKKNLNDFENIEIRSEAVSNEPGETFFYIYPDTPSRNSLLPETGNRQTFKETVPAITLDDILKEYPNSNYIKFDIEGMKYKIFASSQLAQKIKFIIGEIRDCKDFSLQDFLKLFPNHSSGLESLDSKTFLVSLSRDY